MDTYTPTAARKNLYQLIKDVNAQRRPIAISPAHGTKDAEAILVNRQDWDSIVETLYLENTGTLARAEARRADDSGTTDIDDIDWDSL
ncbi:type II toxin-antitoxin system Phd/YefM family antitoxin [Bifidobacterium tibiigranuli]|jgi:PHD/YefM family antitoxin component YafN of YafNO toxin-antitoxin module|uniref:Antitoxin n=1 Tax=Bifidobacterium tibiigranuli TaxID=2172043 RepID=A0A5N6S887_9BIFI|nr:type II toxin-antitoxin system Phd/YefM family antitoxin [Bifidobacterium tibiigranuli]KAE8126247.1 type II toxin-antitoxin system Phd/YefM family antitoxin [Bifidobacterium tibiigranuli]KAE8129911.1 prevent-host-death protein [Bifidobacterium tibiigranuli]